MRISGAAHLVRWSRSSSNSGRNAQCAVSFTVRNGSSSKKPEMADEYGKMDSSGETYVAKNFVLESGVVLPEAHVRYNMFGKLNEARDNVMVVCHALTGNSRLDTWWGSMLGPGKTFDTSRFLIVCANVLGSCYGSTGPRSVNPNAAASNNGGLALYGNSFPDVTIRDTVRLHMQMIKASKEEGGGVGARGVAGVIGGSLGGMQALEWAILGKDFVRATVAIGCGSAHTAWQIGISEAQRQAIYADPKWRNGNVDMNDLPTSGLSVARQMAMLSYRTAKGYQTKFGRTKDAKDGHWQTKKYLEYQGVKFLERFDAVTYVKLTEQMDTHDVGRDRGGVDAALKSIQGKLMVMGIDSDLLYPLHEQEEIAAAVGAKCQFRVISSQEGHDGFLLEQEQVAKHISGFGLL